MAALAHALKIEDVERDPTLVEGITKDCFDCDVDNPKSVAKLMKKLGLGERPANFADMLRAACLTCSGSGQQPFAAAGIAEELKRSKREEFAKDGDGGSGSDEVGKQRSKNRKPKDDDEDLYLEY
jgi:hypothetical protein